MKCHCGEDVEIVHHESRYFQKGNNIACRGYGWTTIVYCFVRVEELGSGLQCRQCNLGLPKWLHIKKNQIGSISAPTCPVHLIKSNDTSDSYKELIEALDSQFKDIE